jgi:Tfp pilus tip-associated adhesin PilY1
MRFLLGAYDPTSNTNLYNRDKSDQDPVTHNLLGHLNIMGDIVNSAPQAVELSKDLADTLPPVVTSDSFYSSAYGSSYTDPHTRLIIVGTNTGHLHCFVEVAAKQKDPVANPNGYYSAKATELWTFLPPNLFPMLWDLYNQRTQTDETVYKHHYGIDGDPVLHHVDVAPPGNVIGDTRVSLNEDAAIIFSFRKGGRAFFALKISDSKSSTPTPAYPRLAWWINPITGNIVTPSGSDSTNSGLIKTMGMSTCVPSFGLVKDSANKLRHAVFITGGYANAEINARYLNDDAKASTTYFQNGLGRLILALNPMDGTLIRSVPWDFRTVTIGGHTIGAIAGGVSPTQVINLGTGLTQRIYFGDFNGGVWAINADNTAANGFRLDSSSIDSWYSSSKARLIYSDPNVRFTTAPDSFRLPGDFPVPVTVGSTWTRPLTVMVAIGSGDRNNPIDAPEDYTITTSVSASPPPYNRFYVFADLQNTSGAISNLKLIDNSWATLYSDAKVTPGSSSFLWGSFDTAANSGSNYHYGYYFDLPHTYASGSPSYLAPAGNSPNSTRDKVLVSPLIKQGAVFYSFYNIYGGSGFACSPFSTTRTFRQCDIARPLWFDPEIDVGSDKVGDITSGPGAQSAEGCSGLAFSFNSLSSQLVDAGDYVMQGGAKASTATDVAGSNTPDIQAVKSTSSNRGFRIRNWRIVR